MTTGGDSDGAGLRIETRRHPEYVELVCSGEYASGIQVEIARAALQAAADARSDLVLVDIRGIGGRAPSMSERYDQAVQVANLQVASATRVRMAVIGREPMLHPQRFGEIVATNRGAMLRVFTDEPAALDWLLTQPRSA